MSELQAIAQQIANLISNSESAAMQLQAFAVQVRQLLVLANNAMKGTKQQDYQNLINQLALSLNQIEFAAKCIAGVSKCGNDWLNKQASSKGAGGSETSDCSGDSFNAAAGNDNESPFRPSGSIPRDLFVSQYGFTKDASGMEIYDSPLEVGKYLYSAQGSAYKNFKGTCGLCSCANVLRLAGADYGEKEMIDYAANAQGGLFAPRLCIVNPLNPDASGGTTPKQRQQILDYFGVSSSVWNVKTDPDGKASLDAINDIAKWVSEGRGVIVDVDAGLFYNYPKYYNQGHAVTITSVEKNKYVDVTAFYILDSNQGTVKYSSWELQEMLRTNVRINVTSQIIR